MTLKPTDDLVAVARSMSARSREARKREIVDKIFGDIQVIRWSPTKKGFVECLCLRCKVNRKDIRVDKLRQGRIKSCGCGKERTDNWSPLNTGANFRNDIMNLATNEGVDPEKAMKLAYAFATYIREVRA